MIGIPNPPIDPSVQRSRYANQHEHHIVMGIHRSCGIQSISKGGQHNQITSPNINVPGSPPSDPASIIFTAPGTARAASPQLFWQNSQATFQLSPIRAWAVIPGNTSGTVTIIMEHPDLFTAAFQQ